jgi:hypothetical protein
MNHQQSKLFSQALVVYLNHSLAWAMQKTTGFGGLAARDGVNLQRYILSALCTQDSILCSVKGIIALVVIDRAAEAFRCSIDSGRNCGELTQQKRTHGAKKSQYELSAKLTANMLAAELQGEAELAELWSIACGLVDVLCSEEQCTASFTLPTKPSKFTYRTHYLLLKPSWLDQKSVACTEKKLWACNTILFIIEHHGKYFSTEPVQLQVMFRAEKIRCCAIAVRDELSAIYNGEGDECAGDPISTMFRSCVKQLGSPGVQSDLHLQLLALPPGMHYSELMSAVPLVLEQYHSPFWYVRAQAGVARELNTIATSVNSLKKMYRTAPTGSAAQLFTSKLCEQYTVIVAAVQASPLFAHPSGDLQEEYGRLLDGTRLIPHAITEDWLFRQHCAAQAADSEHRGVSAAQGITAECWTQAVAAMDKYLMHDTVYEWDSASVESIERVRSQWKTPAHCFTHIADDLVTEVTRLQSTATNSDNAGRWKAAQLWRDAADVQLQIAQRRFRHAMDDVRRMGSDRAAQTSQSDDRLHFMAGFLTKCTHLARGLDSLPRLCYMNDQQMYHMELRRYSVAHCKARCAALLEGRTEHMQACSEHNIKLETIIDTYLAARAPVTTVRLPPALQIRLAAQSPTDVGSAQASAQSPHIAWLPESLYECSALLLRITEQPDLPVRLRDDALQSVKGASEAIQSIVISIASGGPSSVRNNLARNTATAYTSAAASSLTEELHSRCLFKEAAVQFDKALAFYDEKGYTDYWIDFALYVADRVLKQALAKAECPVGTWVATFSSAHVVRLCDNEADQIVEAVTLKAELQALSATAKRLENKELPCTLLVLLKEAWSVCQSCIEAEYQTAKFRLSSRSGSLRYKSSIDSLKHESATGLQTAKYMLDAVRAMSDPLTPPALLHCLQQLAHYRIEAGDPAQDNVVRRIGAARLADWFRNTATAMKRSNGGVVAAAWQQAAEKGKEVHEGENDGHDKALLDAGAAVALCLEDIAVAGAAGMQHRAAWHRTTLVQLQIAEQRLESADEGEAATS